MVEEIREVLVEKGIGDEKIIYEKYG